MSLARAKQTLLRYRRDPCAWVLNVLGRRLWSKQKEILEAVRDNRTVVVASCHAIGKSFTSACIVLWFLCNYPESIVITTAPTARQVKNILWKEIAVAVRDAKYPIATADQLTTTQLKFGEDWYAIGFTTRDGDATRFQGYHAPHILVVGDEASGLDASVFTGIDAVLSGGRAKKVLVGNPTDPASEFAAHFTQEGVAKFYVSAFDTPNFTTFGITIEDIRAKKWREKITGELPYPALITPEWVAEKYASWCGGTKSGETNPLWVARVMGRFPESSRDQLIPLQWIVDAQERSYEPVASDDLEHNITDLEHNITSDIARMGGDEITIGHRLGSRFRIIEAFTHALLTETSGRIINAARAKGATQVRGDVIGVGGGALDIVRETPGFEVIDINASHAAHEPERFPNFRSEMYWSLRDRFNPELEATIDLDPADDLLAAQLACIKFKIMGNGKTQVESKDEIKARMGWSPDRADTCAMAFARPKVEEPTSIGFFFAGQGRA